MVPIGKTVWLIGRDKDLEKKYQSVSNYSCDPCITHKVDLFLAFHIGKNYHELSYRISYKRIRR